MGAVRLPTRQMMNLSNSINRRSFLGRSLVGLGALASAPMLLAQIPQKLRTTNHLLQVNDATGLIPGLPVFIGRDGCATQEPPEDYVVPIGIAYSSCIILGKGRIKSLTPADARIS